MNWFAWRQHRKQFLVVGIILALYAALLIPTGLHFWHTYQSAVASCAQNPANPSCTDLSGSLFQPTIDQALLHLAPLAILLLPLILGLFWGAPLLSKEYTEGTDKLVWTQSVSRRKWLTIKLTWILVATAIFMGAFTALATWWAHTSNSLEMNRFDSGVFFEQGIVPVTYGIFAVALGTMFGAWFRKTMIALGVTLGLYIGFAFITVPLMIRPHYMAPVAVTTPMGPGFSDNIPQGAWVLTRGMEDQNGRVIGDVFTSAPPQCQQVIQQNQVTDNNGRVGIKIKGGSGNPIDACLNKAGWHLVATYQPSYRYWDFQYIESGISLSLSAVAVAATYWLVLKRDA